MEVNAEHDIDKAVLDHLTKCGYTKAAKALKEEAKGKKKPKTKPKKMVDEMLKSFEAGDQPKFISQWNEYVGKSTSTDLYGAKIEFYVRIYFTIFPMHSLNKAKVSDKVVKQRQKEFKKFLDTKGAELSKTSEFLPYYALPYVPNPVDHPSFKQLFSTEWIDNLKEKLADFLGNAVATNDHPSDLARIYYFGLDKGKKEDFDFGDDEGINEEAAEQIALWQNKCREIEKKEQHTKLVFVTSQQKWSNFSRNILIIAKQLMTVIDNSGISESINTVVYNSMKEKIFKYENVLKNIMQGQGGAQVAPSNQSTPAINKSNLLNPSKHTMNHDMSVSPAIHSKGHSPNVYQRDYDNQMSEIRNSPSVISQSVSYIQDNDHSVSRGPRTLPIQISLAPLDYDKIKKFLLESDDDLKVCATLQALRWRVSKTRSYSQRAEVLHTYWHYDILGILGDGPDILIHLLNKSRRILAYTVFLINTMASEPVGRNYLIKYPSILDTIFAVLLNEKQETAIRQQAIVAIQKFSLRTKCQNKMIEMDMIKYIVFILKNELSTLSDYTLEYSTALLMNLSLRKIGKDKCEDPSLELLHVLNELLEHENDQVRTYVNGTLYSIFRRQSLRNQAKEIGMDEILTYLSQNLQPHEDHLKRQIQYILGQLNPENSEDDNESSDEDSEDGEEEEDIEVEDDEEDELEGKFFVGYCSR